MTTIKAYKGFDKDLKCREFQFEVGKTYSHSGAVKICESGFHACINPIDILNYYDPAQSRFCEVELSGKTDSNKEDSKVSAENISIVREVSLSEFVSICADYIVNNSPNKEENSGDSSLASNSGYRSLASNSGDSSLASNSGYRSLASNSGNSSLASNSGDSSLASNSGYRSLASNSGNRSLASNSGDSSLASNSGDRSLASNSGDRSLASNSGDRSLASNSGYSSLAETSGKESVAVATGYQSKARGIIGNWIVIAERNDNYELLTVKSVKVDGKKIKENVFYKVVNGKVVEA